MKKIIHLVLIFFTIFMVSCSEEEYGKSIEQHEQHVKMNKVSFQEMKDFLNQNVNHFPTSLNITFAKGDSNYITEIDSTNITQVINEDTTTFTLHINH